MQIRHIAECISILLTLASVSIADLYRWDTGEAILGTEGIELVNYDGNYSGLQLAYADLHGVNLIHVDFTGSNLMRSDLSHSTIRGNFDNANLREANLDNASFHGSSFHGVDMIDAAISGTDFRNAAYHGFSQQNLYSTANYQTGDLRNIGLSLNKLAGWDFSDQDLTGADFEYSNLIDADLTGAIVEDVMFSGGRLVKEQLYSTQSYQAHQLTEIQLRGFDVSGWSFRGQDLTDADFRRSSSHPTNLAGADFADAIINGAYVPGLSKEQLYSTASYANRDLAGAAIGTIGGLDLRDQNLSKASLGVEDADITGAIITNAKLYNITPQQLYSTHTYSSRNLPETSLTGELEGVDLSGFNLAGSTLGGNASYADLSSANLVGATVWARLAGANLANVNLAGANLERVSLNDANLTGANLSKSDLKDTGLSGADLTGANLYGANLLRSIGFSPTASTQIRNAILPDGNMNLELREGEHLAFMPGMTDEGAHYFDLDITDTFSVEDGATLDVSGYCFGSCRLMRFKLNDGANVALGGTLRIAAGLIGTRLTWQIFDWPMPLEDGNTFDRIELPVGGWDVSQLYSTGSITFIDHYLGNGDFNVDGKLDASDINRLSAAVRAGGDLSFDLNSDSLLDQQDRTEWIHELKNTWLGDANLDGEFNSGDLVDIFQAGHYEDGIAMNSGWAEGDWNGDGDFDTGDLVLAFQDGGYERGPRMTANAVPEPSSAVLLVLGLFGFARRPCLHARG